jgi:hypothetical protein
MLRFVDSKNFISEPSFYKNRFQLFRKESKEFINLEQNEIDELIELLIRTKEQFKK